MQIKLLPCIIRLASTSSIFQVSHPWESQTKTFEDHRTYVWEKNESAKRIQSYIEKVVEPNEVGIQSLNFLTGHS